MRKRGGGEGRVDRSAEFSDPTRDAYKETNKVIKKAYKNLLLEEPKQVKNSITAQSLLLAASPVPPPEERKKMEEQKEAEDKVKNVVDGAGIGKNHNKYFAVYKDYGTFVRDCHPAFHPVSAWKLHMQQA